MTAGEGISGLRDGLLQAGASCTENQNQKQKSVEGTCGGALIMAIAEVVVV